MTNITAEQYDTSTLKANDLAQDLLDSGRITLTDAMKVFKQKTEENKLKVLAKWMKQQKKK